MSRRTRTKFKRNHDHYGLGSNHHNQYSSSTSYFPKSYSALGKEIRFPSMGTAFLLEGKITFYGSLDIFEEKIFKLTQQELQSVHTLNIGFKGRIVQVYSQLNNCIFAFSMIICCVSQIFNADVYRDRFYTKYSFSLTQYTRLINILQKMSNLQTVLLTFQDNKLNKTKFQLLDQSFASLNLKFLTLRNLTYFIYPEQKISYYEGQIDQFNEIKKTKTEFNFVWEKQIVKYNAKCHLDEEKQSIAASLCDQI